MIVGSAAGVWRTRTVQRRTDAERWDPDTADFVGGLPWKTLLADSSTDGPLEKVELGLRWPQTEMELVRLAEEPTVS